MSVARGAEDRLVGVDVHRYLFGTEALNEISGVRAAVDKQWH